jgi:hypothetical protein
MFVVRSPTTLVALNSYHIGIELQLEVAERDDRDVFICLQLMLRLAGECAKTEAPRQKTGGAIIRSVIKMQFISGT